MSNIKPIRVSGELKKAMFQAGWWKLSPSDISHILTIQEKAENQDFLFKYMEIVKKKFDLLEQENKQLKADGIKFEIENKELKEKNNTLQKLHEAEIDIIFKDNKEYTNLKQKLEKIKELLKQSKPYDQT